MSGKEKIRCSNKECAGRLKRGEKKCPVCGATREAVDKGEVSDNWLGRTPKETIGPGRRR